MEGDLHTLTINICVNSSPPSVAYMCQLIGSALVQIMACRLFGAKAVSKPMLEDQNTKFFIHENALENIVCEMVAILSRGAMRKWRLVYDCGS